MLQNVLQGWDSRYIRGDIDEESCTENRCAVYTVHSLGVQRTTPSIPVVTVRVPASVETNQ